MSLNAAHLYLLLNHLPIILTPVGLALLGYGVVRRVAVLARAGVVALVAAAVSTRSTYLTGDAAARVVTRLPDVDAASRAC